MKHITWMLIHFTVCLSFLCGCNDAKQTEGVGDVVRLDMEQSKAVDFDSLVKNISCIKLSAEGAPFFTTCERVIRYKGHIYLLGSDRGNGKVLIYKDAGEFLKEVSSSEFLVNTILIEPAVEQLWVVGGSKLIEKFKLDGTPVDKVISPFPFVDLVPVNKKEFLVYSEGLNRTADYSAALTDFTSIRKTYLPKTQAQHFFLDVYTPGINPEDIFIFPAYSDTIYCYNAMTEEMKPYYQLDFHGDFLTEKMYPEKGFTDKEMSDIITNRKYIYAHANFRQASGRLFFKLAGKRDDFCTIRLKDHSVQSFHSLFDAYDPTTYNPFVGCDGKSLYFIVQESDLVKHYQSNKCTYSAIQKLLPALSAEGNNWILLRIEINE